MSEGARQGSCSLWDGEFRAKGNPVASEAEIARHMMVMRLQPGKEGSALTVASPQSICEPLLPSHPKIFHKYFQPKLIVVLTS